MTVLPCLFAGGGYSRVWLRGMQASAGRRRVLPLQQKQENEKKASHTACQDYIKVNLTASLGVNGRSRNKTGTGPQDSSSIGLH